MTTGTQLRPAMPHADGAAWPGARWIGSIDLPVPSAGRIELADVDGYAWARLLVRSGGAVRGFVEVPIVGDAVDASELRIAVDALPAVTPGPAADPTRPVTIVVCTRNRAELLAESLDALRALDHEALELVVVDNAPSDDRTARLVADLDDPRVRYVLEPRPGLARARNRGLLEASHDTVAFTDDDVRVDAGWLAGLLAGFDRGADVVCVTGQVPAGELRTPAQAAFEHRVGWAEVRSRVFRTLCPPADLPLFPYQVGCYGTGASFAVDRAEVIRLGAFDEALGAGSPSKGGEDIDLFFRVVTAGHALAYEPASIAWHRHRDDASALTGQAAGYGRGLGAWLGKIARRPGTLLPAVRRALRATRHLASLGTEGATPVPVELRDALAIARRAERRAVVGGVLGYARARRATAADQLFDGGAR